MRKIIGVVFGLLCLAGTSRAQDTPKAELSGSYSYLREGGSDGVNANGGSFSLAGNVHRWFGIAGDFGIYHAAPSGISLNTYSYLLGPRFSFRKSSRVMPVAQGLVGGGHLTAGAGAFSGSTSGFAYGPGAGVGFGISRRIALRPPFDYIAIRSGSDTLNTYRASFGVVFRFGAK